MKSVLRTPYDEKNSDTIRAIFDCIRVKTPGDYLRVAIEFNEQTTQVQKDSLLEIEKKLLKTNYYIHDRYCMVIFRITDSEGYAVPNYDLILTASEANDPDMLPNGFFVDRQLNSLNKSTITYYFNYDVMKGSAEVKAPDGEIIRKALPGIDTLGLIIRPRPDEGFIRYLPCSINASKELFEKVLKPNSTTLIDICLQRVVNTEIFRFEKTDGSAEPDLSFKKIDPGNDLVKTV